MIQLTRESSTRSVRSLQECLGDDQMDVSYPSRKRIRTRRNVSFDESKTQTIPVLSLGDFTPEELTATYYSRQEYAHMRDCIKHTVRFLKYRQYPPPSFAPHIDVHSESDMCVRGLECLADDYVNMHRKRARELSMGAVFAYQNACLIQNTFLEHCAIDVDAMAQAYSIHTQRAQQVAGRWGHFDALDAGIQHKATSTSTPEVIAIDC